MEGVDLSIISKHLAAAEDIDLSWMIQKSGKEQLQKEASTSSQETYCPQHSGNI